MVSNKLIIFLLFLHSFYIYRITAFVVNAIAFSLNGGSVLYSPIISEFNQYASEKNLNITLNLNLITNDNSTNSITDYEERLESLFHKKSDKYDIIFYDNIYTARFEPYLLDLKDALPKEHVDMYITQTGFYNDRIVGLPIVVDYSVLYINKDILFKYNRAIPKTWDELIETSKYILNEEHKLNNTNFIAYNGLFDDTEYGTCSINEFIYSFRKTRDSPFPDLTSTEAINALRKIKEIKNEISSDIIFKSSMDYFLKKFKEKNFLFLKFWYIKSKRYLVSALPGAEENISGSALGGHNAGINIYSKLEKRKEVIEAFQFITSKDMQRKYIVSNNYYSAIPSLYDEEEVCSIVDCNYFKNIQLTARQFTNKTNYDQYSYKFREYVYEYIYGNKSEIEVLKNIKEIDFFYYPTLSTRFTVIWLIYFIFIVCTSILMLLSLCFIFINKYKMYFQFLPKDLWIITVVGFVISISPFYTMLGQITNMKCYIKDIIQVLGPSLFLIPVLSQLIINFPEKDNKISKWVKNNRYLFILFFVIVNMLLYGLLKTFPYTIVDYTFVDYYQLNYKACKMNNVIGLVVIQILYGISILTTLSILILTFLEWNLKATFYDIRFIVTDVYFNILFFMVIIIINSIETNNFLVDHLVKLCVHIIYTLTNYMLLYGYRIVYALKQKDLNDTTKNTKYNKKFYVSHNSSFANNTANELDVCHNENRSKNENLNKIGTQNLSLKKKLFNYHYKTTIDNNNSNNNDSYIIQSKIISENQSGTFN